MKLLDNDFKLHFSIMEGKLDGIGSLSTSCMCNPICLKRMEHEDWICRYCYSVRHQKYRKSLKDHIDRNYEILQSRIPDDKIPFTPYAFVRLEAFGDIGSSTHLINYVEICNRNPQSTFALWTKNYGYLESVFSKIKKPENLVLVVSSPKINEELDPVILNRVEEVVHIDVLFTVYDKEHWESTPIETRCGMKCIKCLKCYTRHADTIKISELKK